MAQDTFSAIVTRNVIACNCRGVAQASGRARRESLYESLASATRSGRNHPDNARLAATRKEPTRRGSGGLRTGGPMSHSGVNFCVKSRRSGEAGDEPQPNFEPEI